jgi:hypothetical protein
MPITQITIKNFKGVADAVIVPLPPMNTLFPALQQRAFSGQL